jgi:hypothetical protein
MSDSGLKANAMAGATREEIMSALFANLVMQNTNMALMFMGQVPHPETGEKMQELEGARMFIDQLEMLEAKTKNNLTKEEDRLLKQSLTHLRMSFVQAIENQNKAGAQPKTEPARTPQAPANEPAPAPTEEESRKKFTKKY